jgi:hypothetical protein
MLRPAASKGHFLAVGDRTGHGSYHQGNPAGDGSMIDERRQFRVLYRGFLFRVIDIELLSASGEVHNLLAQFAALLAAYSSVLALFTVTHFTQSADCIDRCTKTGFAL